MIRRRLALSVVGLLALIALPAQAEMARIAVAANFGEAAHRLADAYRETSGHELHLSLGSTGQLYAQIAHGAPFDVFLAADAARPARAIEEGLAVAGSARTYAVGQLVLWSADPDRVSGPEALRDPGVTRIAIANPQTAPYGAAAIEVLEALGLRTAVSARLVRGNSVAQAFQFVQTENAELGLVAASQIVAHPRGSGWPVDPALHRPIRQDAVLLAHGADNPVAQGFLDFLSAPDVVPVLTALGYLPGVQTP